jgi:N-acetyl-gamma-glutamyl-phosphate reductase
MIKIGIIGGAGYTGGELLRILVNHPQADIRFIHSNSNAGNPIAHVHTDLLGMTDLNFTDTLDKTSMPCSCVWDMEMRLSL